jgi:3-isopropylmalate/(R)-2-methylmalate dehydratase small subunit
MVRISVPADGTVTILHERFQDRGGREKAMGRNTKLQGRIWTITDSQRRLIDDIDTDQIYHNAHLAITDIREMGKFAFGNLRGWEDFPSKARPGDIVVVGKNFGAGSSRQQAVDCFVSLAISLLIGESFGAIYKRNAINSGFPVLECDNLTKAGLKSGDQIEVDVASGEIRIVGDEKRTIHARPFSQVQMDIYQAGNLFEYGKILRQK